MTCESVQAIIVEGVVLHGRDAQWNAEVSAHLEVCLGCRTVLEQELELSGYLSEPVPLPPADLVTGVLQRIAERTPAPVETPEPALSWAERFAWAASGAAAMFCLERIPTLAEGWTSQLSLELMNTVNVVALPFEINGLFLASSALLLGLVQGAMIYRVRSAPA